MEVLSGRRSRADNEAFSRGIVPADNCVTLDKPEITGAIAAPDPIMRIIKSTMGAREEEGGGKVGDREGGREMDALRVDNRDAAWPTFSLSACDLATGYIYGHFIYTSNAISSDIKF